MFLVDDDETDVGERREDRQSRPDDDVRLARPDAAPLVGPLSLAEARVDERDPSVEVRPKAVDQRQGKGDLGNEDESRATRLERRCDGLDVDGRLSATGHAVEHERARVAGRDGRPDSLDRVGLRWEQVAGRRPAAAPSRWSCRQRPPRALPDVGLGETASDQARDRAAAVTSREVGAGRLAGGGRDQLGERIGLARTERTAVRPFARGDRTTGRTDPDPALVPRPRPGTDQRPLEAHPAIALERPQPAEQTRTPIRPGEVADGARTAFELGHEIERDRVVGGGPDRTDRLDRTGRELRDQLEPLQQAGWHHRPEHQCWRRQVVRGDRAGQREGQRWQQRPIGPHPFDDGFQVRSSRAGLGLGHDDPEGLPPPELHEDRLAGRQVRERLRHEICVRPVASPPCRVDGDLDGATPGPRDDRLAGPHLQHVASSQGDRG